ncbi:efflux RND transporter permease subunit [Actibacterium sp. 188UL27-1]|uniref:efflux RND transporter permease subunit n=1 Tax=Actibacterium sp. 188UL27-1 TaxID=2786961 RepID=UPI00195A3D47|nr:efflux RND transporter permease subunit [Actibacterium sp. 188UL27-1]MBM7068960.1 efflux RND transporter permease subunit [Actibacterium sp. 188UL27-1]
METLTFRQPRLVALILMVLIAAGASSFLSLGRQEDPTITNLFATITTSFPGADPARVEALVTAKLEEELREIPEVDTIDSVSGNGISVVSVELLETLDEATIEQVWGEARDAVEDARRDFPAGVQVPDFDADGISAYSTVIAVNTAQPDVPISLVSRYAEGLADRLRGIPGTKAVELFGQPDEEVLVAVDMDRAAALGLTAQDIATAIQSADGKVQAGRLRNTGTDLAINISGEIKALDRLRTITVRQSADGALTLLDDIATITRGAKTPAEELALYNGKPAILLGVLAQDNLQIDRWMGFVHDLLDQTSAEVPVGMERTLVFDQSTYTQARLAEVGTNMAIGVALVVAVLFFTLGVRAAAIVALILPVVSLATLATMNIIGLPIHQMSVTGLIVALGLLVDAAIVMSDEVRQRLLRGMARIDAVGQSVKRLVAPLLASTVTTALSFTPMILLPGPAGDFVGSIAIAVVLILFWSLFLAVTVTPALAGWILPTTDKGGIFASGIKGGALGRAFQRTIQWSVNNPIKSIAVALILPVLGFAAFPTLTAQFFPGVDRDQFYLEVEMPGGTSIIETEQVAREIDMLLADDDGINSVYWSIGKSGPAFYYNIVGDRSREPGFAQALINSASPEASKRLVPELQETLDQQFPKARILVRGLVQGPPVAAPVELRFVGQDITVLRELGDEARSIMSDLDFVTQVRSTVSGGVPKIRYDIDEAKVRLLGLDLTTVAAQLQASLEGVTGGSLVEGTEELPVRVRFTDTLRSNLSAVSDLPIQLPTAAILSANGQLSTVPLSELATARLEPAESVITRRNGERANTVQAYIPPNILPEEALKAVQTALDDRGFTVPAGYRLELGGDSDARSNTLGNLLASVGLIVTLTIATIVLTFNSFRLSAITLVVAILSAGLSMLALAVFQYPFGINAIIGVIGSIGVSINAAIIILTGLQADEKAAQGDKAAMAQVVSGSSRHIVSTTITTFGGFLPLILAGGGFWPPFAMSIAGGVLLSTVISFYFTPPMFALFYRKKAKQAQPVEAAETQQQLPISLPMAAE